MKCYDLSRDRDSETWGGGGGGRERNMMGERGRGRGGLISADRCDERYQEMQRASLCSQHVKEAQLIVCSNVSRWPSGKALGW